MLRLLRVRNFAIIDSLELEFHSGLNVLTGETGAGKSIVLDALGMILGNRAASDLIRSGCNEASVEAIFDLAGGETLIKRVIQHNGKNRAYLNDELVTLGHLTDFCENLVDLCSQHENQSLSKAAFQLDLLDRYGGLSEQQNKIREIHSAWRSLENEKETLKKTVGETAMNEDFLRFQLREIEDFAPKENEDALLQAEHRKLRSVGALLEGCQNILQLLRDADAGGDAMSVSEALGKTKQRLARMIEQDPALQPSLALAQQMIEETADLCSKIDAYSGAIDADSARLQEVEERLTKLGQLKRKHGNSIAEILAKKQKLEEQLSEASSFQDRLRALEEKTNGVVGEYAKLAQQLSKKRAAVARTLQDTVSAELKELRMAASGFEVEFTKIPLDPVAAPEGMDKIQFLFSANVGEEKKPLGRVASGGELSRLMLALRRTLGDRGGIGVYVFDEIDAGIGGQTGTLVGKKLKEVAAHNQVLCITHLPQVAAFAESHFVVEKKVVGARTVSTVTALQTKERVDEIARMLGGSQITEKARAHAKALLKECAI